MRPPLRPLLAGALLLLLAWAVLPTSLGGKTAYVATHGNSMAPRFHTGDLAVLRSADRYAVGDVVAYHSRLLDTTVMHRIVAVRGGAYVFKGDHNTFLDPEQPHADQLIGTLRLRVPQGGLWLARLTHPAILAAISLTLLMTGTQTRRSRDRRRRGTSTMTTPTNTRSRANWPTTVSADARHAGLVAAALLGAFGVLLALVAWQAPRETQTAAAPPAGSSTTFSYHAAVANSPVYDGNTVTSPDPVFRRLANLVQVDIGYTGPPGTMSITADVAAPSGWHTRLPLHPPTAFSGTTQRASIQLDLNRIDDRATAAARAIGIPYDQLTIAIVAKVRTRDGQQLTPTLTLVLSAAQLKLAGGPNTLTVSGPALQPQDSTTDVIRVLGYSAAPRTLGLAALGALLGAAALGVLTMLVSGRKAVDEAKAIHARHRKLLLPIKPPPPSDPDPVIEVQEFPALVRIAERYGAVIMTWTNHGSQHFMVQDQGTRYQYTLPYERRNSRTDRRQHTPTASAHEAGNGECDAWPTPS